MHRFFQGCLKCNLLRYGSDRQLLKLHVNEKANLMTLNLKMIHNILIKTTVPNLHLIINLQVQYLLRYKISE